MNRLLLYFFVFFRSIGLAQEKEVSEETFKPHHSIAALLGHSHLSQGEIDGQTKWIVLPSIGLDYNYYFSKKWSAGLHSDMVVENFKVENESNQIIERTKPIAAVLMSGFKPGKHFTFQAGLGGDYSKEESFFVTRFGIEYSIELPDNWEFIANAIYDNKWSAYDSLGISLGVAKTFGN